LGAIYDVVDLRMCIHSTAFLLGQKTCAHIHGVFPYISILNDPSIADLDKRLACELDRAINEFLGSAAEGRSSARYNGQHHVFSVTRVRGRYICEFLKLVWLVGRT
jgi:hypothetical protein